MSQNHRLPRLKLSEYIAYLTTQAGRFMGDPDICYCDWLMKPEVYELANGEIAIAEERNVTSYESSNGNSPAKN